MATNNGYFKGKTDQSIVDIREDIARLDVKTDSILRVVIALTLFTLASNADKIGEIVKVAFAWIH